MMNHVEIIGNTYALPGELRRLLLLGRGKKSLLISCNSNNGDGPANLILVGWSAVVASIPRPLYTSNFSPKISRSRLSTSPPLLQQHRHQHPGYSCAQRKGVLGGSRAPPDVRS